MATHDVKFSVPERPLGNVDVDFIVRKDGDTFGTFKLSKGGIDWYRKHAKKGIRISWTALANLIEQRRGL